MVKFTSLIMAFICLILFSCSEKNASEVNFDASPAVLSISITGNSTTTKAVGATENDINVNDINVFVFKSDGSLDVSPIFILNPEVTPSTNTIRVTTGAHTVYVLANYGEQLSGIGNLNDLLETNVDLANGESSSQLSENVYMTGTSLIEWKEENGIQSGYARTILNFNASRITVSVDLKEFKNPYGENHITVDKLILIYAGKTGRIFSSSLQQAIQTEFYTGDKSYEPRNIPDAVEKSFLSEIIRFGESESVDYPHAEMITYNPHFYTFANNAENQATILTLRGTRNGENFYWPIHFNIKDAGYTLRPGFSYDVKLRLKGDTSNGSEAGGTDNPEISIIPASLEVEITPAEWQTVIIDRDFE